MLTKNITELHAILSKAKSLSAIAKVEVNVVSYEMEQGTCTGQCIIYEDKVAIQRAVVSPGARMKPHKHDKEEEILIVVDGDMTVVMGDEQGGVKEVRILENGIVLIPAKTSHVVTSGNGCKLIGITVPAADGYPI